MKKAARISEAGFSIVDLVVVVAIIAVISGITIPLMLGAIDRMRLGQSVREVERELQQAKQRAVGKGSVLRVHFNCPTAGEFRSVELIGTTSAPLGADTASATRCGITGYPFPAPDNNPLTRPNLDGPPRFLDRSVTFGAVQSIEFWSDGTAHYNNAGANPWPMIPTAGIALTMVRSGKTASITVNGLGKVQLQ
jgi:type II secretory pathway pseudopilin PulG